MQVVATGLGDGGGRVVGLELVRPAGVGRALLRQADLVVHAEALVDIAFVQLAGLGYRCLAGSLVVLPHFHRVAATVLANADGAAGAVALVAIRPVAFAILVDLDIAIDVAQVLGGGVVVLAGLVDDAAVVAATKGLLDEGLVALAGLPGGGLAAFLAVLPHGGFIADALLGLQRFVVRPNRLAGEGIVVAAAGVLGDLAAVLEQLVGVAGVVLAVGALLDIAGALGLHRQVVVALAGLGLGGRGEWRQGLADFGDVFLAVLGLGRGAVSSHGLTCKGQDDSGT
ncbi:hypothetical protein D3C72_721960 [compost metagenome]